MALWLAGRRWGYRTVAYLPILRQPILALEQLEAYRAWGLPCLPLAPTPLPCCRWAA